MEPRVVVFAAAMLLIGGACAWAFLRATPAVPMAPEPYVGMGDTPAVLVLPAKPVAERVVPPGDTPAVVAATIDDGVANEPASAIAVATPQAVPNRLSLSVDELVRAGLAQDVAEDLVDALNGTALLLEQPQFTLLLQDETVQIQLALAPLLPKAVADGAVTVTRTDEIERRTSPSTMISTAGLYCDGIVYRFGTRRGSLEFVVRERAVPPELWQRYVAKNATKGWASIVASHARRAKGR